MARYILCAECKQLGGTLIKRGDVYIHQTCPNKASVLHPSTGLILPPPTTFRPRKS